MKRTQHRCQPTRGSGLVPERAPQWWACQGTSRAHGAVRPPEPMRTDEMLSSQLRAHADAQQQVTGTGPLIPAEVDEDAAAVLGVLLDPVLEGLDLLLFQEPEHVLLELARALARDDLHERGLGPDRLVDDVPQGAVDVVAVVVDVVQVQLELHRVVSDPPVGLRYAASRRPVSGPGRAAGFGMTENCRQLVR